MLNEFYKKILVSLGLYITEDGFIKTSSKKDAILVSSDGVPIVLPTQEHIGSVLAPNEETGKLEIVKIPYNPLNENVVKGDSVSLIKTKNYIEVTLGYAINVIGELLLILAASKDKQSKTNIEINEFLASINVARAPNIKELVDDKSIENWVSLYIKQSNIANATSIFLKKGGVSNGTKYNRLASISFPVYDELLKADKHTPIHGVNLRAKDITIFKLVYEFIIDGIKDEPHTVSIGSNDTSSPAFISLMLLCKKIGDRVGLLKSLLKDIDIPLYDSVDLDTSLYTENDILTAPNDYKSTLETIPNEHDLARQIHIEKISVTSKPEPKGPDIKMSQLIPQQQPQYQQQMVMPQQQHPVAYQSPVDTMYEDDPIKRILYGNNIPVQRAYTKEQMAAMQQQQQGMMMQQPMGGYQQPYPMQQQPMGIPQQGMMTQQPMGVPQQGMAMQQPMGGYQQPYPIQQQGMMMQQPMSGYQQPYPMQQQPMGIPQQGMMMQQPMGGYQQPFQQQYPQQQVSLSKPR